MPWLKLFHITAVIVWCGALLYLPPLIAASRRGDVPVSRPGVPRAVLIGIATPAALLAITSGTAIFLWQGPLAGWLVVKLGLVSVLTLCHGACAWLLLKAERAPTDPMTLRCAATGLLSVLCLFGIAWLALDKPF